MILSLLPDTIDDVDQLDDLLSQPTEAALDVLSRIEGDLIVLGAGGKMGPSLAQMARRADETTGLKRTILGVDRYFSPETRQKLEARHIKTLQGDLLDPAFLEFLPEVPNVVFMAGMKFGSSGNQSLTWALNAYLPSLVCRKFRTARIVAFSTGNVYGLTPVDGGGSVETDPPNPCGEYAMSCLGRERMFEYFSETLDLPVALIRLNYAVEMRYGVLVDLAQKVHQEEEIDLTMGYVNVIWQGDALAAVLCALDVAASPARFLNVTGPERLRVRDVARQFGRLLGKTPRFVGAEAPEALLNNAAESYRLYGKPRVSAEQMIPWIAHWINRGQPSLGKPTHYEVRNGVF
ncbi:MAG: NAD(P)-dependent oxidoreductase [Pirellulales bacterium]|nr:NAD(P)-dependent oxidoreductase [Pirellulales bacterium]